MDCPYCGVGADLIESKAIHSKYIKYELLYVCRNFPECDSYVSANPSTLQPNGTLANAELRYWRKRAHKEFDKLWKDWGMWRRYAYFILAQEMNLPKEKAHIGLFDVEQCKQVVLIFSNMPAPEMRPPAPKPSKPIKAKKFTSAALERVQKPATIGQNY